MNLTSFSWSSSSSSGLKVSPATLAHIGGVGARPPGGGSGATCTCRAWTALGGVIEISIAAGSGWDCGPRRGRVFRRSAQEDPNLAPRLNCGHSLLSWTNGGFKVQRCAEVSPASPDKLSHLLIAINDLALCEYTDHIHEFSVIIVTDWKSYKVGYHTQLNELCYFEDGPAGYSWSVGTTWCPPAPCWWPLVWRMPRCLTSVSV